MNKLFVLVILLISVLSVKAQDLNFIGEEIDFTVEEEVFAINGLYFFTNTGESVVKSSIFFPVDSTVGSVFDVNVFNFSHQSKMKFKYDTKGIYFVVEALAGETVCINISYSQKLQKKNMYVLTSTQHWNRALDFARYSFSSDIDLTHFSFNMSPDTIQKNVYFWNKQEFLLKEEFVVFYNK
jgi:hypothetical protein